MSVRTFFGAPLKFIQDEPDLLLGALAYGQRVEGCTGELLDGASLVGSAGGPRGPYAKASPGLTWLATMSLPTLRPVRYLPHDTPVVGAVCAYAWPNWPTLMAWPLWSEPLDGPSLDALLTHPLCNPYPPRDTAFSLGWTDWTPERPLRRIARRELATLGVFDMGAGAWRRRPDLDPHTVTLGPTDPPWPFA